MLGWSVILAVSGQSKKVDKYQESVQSSTTPDQGYRMGKSQKHN